MKKKKMKKKKVQLAKSSEKLQLFSYINPLSKGRKSLTLRISLPKSFPISMFSQAGNQLEEAPAPLVTMTFSQEPMHPEPGADRGDVTSGMVAEIAICVEGFVLIGRRRPLRNKA